jgi:2-polyprenyl-3-methyl-5-hydroxy-6-metoxy-1,4-benzoquinol methylase
MTSDSFWQQPFETLRQKWHEVPIGLQRQTTRELVSLSDAALLDVWRRARTEATTGRLYYTRGWCHDLYRDQFRLKRLLDVGSGMGFDGVTFAQRGADVTFVDVVETNLEVVKRICGLLGVADRSHFLYLHDLDSLKALDPGYDVIWCNGSMHHAPFEVVRAEAQELLRHLLPEGRWIQLAYPRARWEREGQRPFSEWGKGTDGEATPWAEWYDLQKVLALLDPVEFDVILAFEFHSSDFNWFDLKCVADGQGSSTSGSMQTWFERAGYAPLEQVERLRALMNEETRRLQAERALMNEETRRLQAELDLRESRLRALCHSRWRRAGQVIGLAKRLPWEDDYWGG